MDDSTLELTREEILLIKKHFRFNSALATREREPQTDSQRHFAAMCEGRCIAETAHEHAYVRHMRLLAGEREGEDDGQDIPQDEVGLPGSGWCTDSDSKKARTGNHVDMKRRNNY